MAILGAFRSSSGLAQGARLYANRVEREGRAVIRVDITEAMVQQPTFSLEESGAIPLKEFMSMKLPCILVIHANPPQFHLVLFKLGKRFLHNKKIIGYWAWELAVVPDVWRHALQYLDAVEVPSAFVREALLPCTDKEVVVVPHVLEAPQKQKTAFACDGIVRCLFIFDMGSAFARKNPMAALEAFRLAFKPGEAEMTFKVSSPQVDYENFKKFEQACAQVPGVSIMTETLDDGALEELYLKHDIYLSLHRSEGYGLTIHEALLYGLHAVATGWSGNMDFMDAPKAHAVPYSLVPMQEKNGAFKGLKARWAEADVTAAAEILRKLRLEILAEDRPAA
jgi:glycosyltransferase involved in cell wall biosynthesis